jgi:hypothetical protein
MEKRVVGQEILRAVDLEVVVVVGVEFGERLGIPHQFEMLDRTGRGIAGVVPALERRHEYGVGERRPVRGSSHAIHPTTPVHAGY